MAAKQKFQELIEAFGGAAADEAIETLLKDTQNTELKPLSQFVTTTWRDCFSPAMVNLGCQFVGGKTGETEKIAVSISLINLSLRIWDDVIDDDFNRSLRPTFVGKFGKNKALIYGGLVSAKAFSLANEVDFEPKKKRVINDLLLNYCETMAISEVKDLNAKVDGYSAKNKLDKIETETINIQTCLKIGAIIGNGLPSDIELLENYGYYLGIMLELLKDFSVSLNFTIELESKLHSGNLPLLLLLAKEESEQIRSDLDFLGKKRIIEPNEISQLITTLLKSNSWNQFTTLFCQISEKCQGALISKDNSAAKILKSIARTQSKAFWAQVNR